MDTTGTRFLDEAAALVGAEPPGPAQLSGLAAWLAGAAGGLDLGPVKFAGEQR